MRPSDGDQWLAFSRRRANKAARLRSRSDRRRRHANRYKLVAAHEPRRKEAKARYKINRGAVRRVPRNAEVQAKFPANFCLLTNTAETLRFFQETRVQTFENPSKKIMFLHGTIERVGPEAAIVLIAELALGNAYTRGLEMLTERNLTHMDPSAFEILDDIGYWEYFGNVSGPPTTDKSTASILHHVHGYVGDTEFIFELMQHFEPDKHFGKAGRQALALAIVECMANAVEHAYPEPQRLGRYLHNHWWACGYKDVTRNEISFCFYDQGVGIPATIRRRLADALPLWLLGRSDPEIIADAIIHGHASRTRQTTRGRGLPSLKAIFAECFDATVTVISQESSCEISKTGDDVAVLPKILPVGLNGTLVVWKLRTKL